MAIISSDQSVLREIPLKITGVSESIYAGFWSRFGAMLLDAIIITPVVFLIIFMNGLGKDIFWYTVIPHIFFSIWYHVYLPKTYGGTPGKLLINITIIRIDGAPIGWREAALRHIVDFTLMLLTLIVTMVALTEANEETYVSLGWMERTQYLKSLTPVSSSLLYWLSNIWGLSEFIVLLTNERKRALHDYMAGTVVVRSEYVIKIREVMTTDEGQGQLVY